MSLDVAQAVKAVETVVKTLKGLREQKQGWDLLCSRGIVKFLTHGVGWGGVGMRQKSPNPKAGHPGAQNVGVAGGGSGSYSAILGCLTTVVDGVKIGRTATSA